MSKKLVSIKDLQNIAVGTTILGSGGGGDPECDLLLACYFTELYAEASLISVDEVEDDTLVVPVGFMGAPSVGTEMLTNGFEFDSIFAKIEEHFQKKIGAIVASEIGGSNGLVPFSISARTRIPVVDADTLGRAFPELQMSSCTLFNIAPSPCFLADSLGNVCTLHEATSKEVENKGRVICAQMGSSAAVSLCIMTAKEAKVALLRGTVTLAKEVGRLAKEKNRKALQDRHDLKIITSGCVIDVQSRNDRGFLEGKIVIQCPSGLVEVLFQNEYLLAKGNQSTFAVTPDIICLFEKERFIPLCVENVRYGYEVELAVLPSPKLWKTKEGLALVGPSVFGYEVT